MKIYLPRKVRLVLLIIFTILFIACTAGFVWSIITSNKTEVEDIAVYQYYQEAVVDYKVNLLPNNFFIETSLSSEQPAYLMTLTDSIDTVLNYNFEAEEAIEYQGQYQITGAVKAYARLDKDTEVVIWQKNYVYSPDSNFSGNDKMISFTNSVNIPLQSYLQNLSQLEETTRFSASRADLEINYVISLKGKNGHGDIEEKLNPTLIIPLKGNVFTVGGKLQDGKDGAITVSQTKPVENKLGDKVIYLGIGLFWLLLLGSVVIFTTNAPDPTAQEKLLKVLLRKHGERIVVLNKMPATTGDAISLDSFDDMVKVADELEQPIFYYQDRLSDCLFIIFDEPYTFQYRLKVVTESQTILLGEEVEEA